MTIHDVEEQLESALAADEDERTYFIRQALQVLADDRLDAPQLHAIRDQLESALDADAEDVVRYLRPAVAMLVEYRATGDLQDVDAGATDTDSDSDTDDRDRPRGELPSVETLAFDPAAIEEQHTIQKTVTIELPEEIARAVGYRLVARADRGDPVTQLDVEEMACDYAVAREQFTVAPDGQPLAEWLEKVTGLQVADSDDLIGDGEARPGSNTCISDSER